MKFLVDQPLGGLAKRLRFLGFDAPGLPLNPCKPHSLPPSAPDTYILTRQQALRKLARPDLIVITAAAPQAQLEEVFGLLKISRRHLAPLSRCSRCNQVLSPVSRDQVLGRVPEHVFHHYPQFYECPACRRLFWPGSHLKGISEKLLAKLENID